MQFSYSRCKRPPPPRDTLTAVIAMPALSLLRVLGGRPGLALRRFSAAAAPPPPPSAFLVVGAGTAVGKTVLSAALARAAARAGVPLAYVKPVQSGHPPDDDAAFVAAAAAPAPAGSSVLLHALGPPASPDLAARLAGAAPLADDALLAHVRAELAAAAERGAHALVEGAGGVLSPFPAGTPQADVLRALALPAVLVGDPALGGVSNTLAAREALLVRGFQVPAVVFFEADTPLRENAATVRRVVDAEADPTTAVFSAPRLPEDPAVPLGDYFAGDDSNSFFASLLNHLLAWDARRVSELAEMQRTAPSMFWYPFTQHASLAGADAPAVTAIDSAHGDTFTVLDTASGTLQPMEDSIGSWWTTGVGHGHSGTARAVGGAAGRYGHVMFPEAAHRPAWLLARKLLDGPGRGWAARAFFSDNGSTAVEVSLKMAFRKRAHDFPDRAAARPMRAVTLHGCYHGDTLGAMDCAPASDFNLKQTPWYQDRGLAFHAPTLALVDGVWTRCPAEDAGGLQVAADGAEIFTCRDEAFDVSRDGSQYRAEIAAVIDGALDAGDFDLGALLMEPVLQGAGGMRLIDPAFQRALVGVCRERGIPIVYDEVFSGLWRLGHETAADLLGTQPDIASYAKLLTGGVVPMSVTLASQGVFDAFLGDSKLDALLHGHSYTAHPIGCAAALEALETYPRAALFDSKTRQFGDFWDEGVARELSSLPNVSSVTVIGTVLAVELLPSGGLGYSATAGVSVANALKARGVFSRPLGNVVYVMCSPVTTREACSRISSVLSHVLEGHYQEEVV